jgi:hypothetical protein
MFSKIVRRTHMYLALFLSPWVLMYAASTIAMNHANHIRALYGGMPPEFVPDRETTYDGTFPSGAPPQAMAIQLLGALGLDGAHNARRQNDGALVVQRLDPVTPRRITFTPADRKVVVEKLEFRTNAFLERMHRRRGFDHRYASDLSWGVSVDVFIVAMVFWVLSGLWMWWELKVTRTWGAVFGLAGAGLFAFFISTL